MGMYLEKARTAVYTRWREYVNGFPERPNQNVTAPTRMDATISDHVNITYLQ